MCFLVMLFAAQLGASDDDLPGKFSTPPRKGIYKVHTFLRGGTQLAVIKGSVECVGRIELGAKLTPYWRWADGRLQFHAITPREKPWDGQYLAYDPAAQDLR